MENKDVFMACVEDSFFEGERTWWDWRFSEIKTIELLILSYFIFGFP